MIEAPNNIPPQDPATRLKFKKRMSVVLVCFSIAMVFWLLLALSHDYPTTLTFPVTYTDLPGKKVVMNELPEKITLFVKTSGFKILSYDFQKEKKAIEVDVGSKLTGTKDLIGDLLAIPTVTFSSDFNRQLGNEITLLSFQPDSIVFNFSDRVVRKLPVKLDLDLSLEKQYDTSGTIRIVPDSILVSGPPSVVEKLNFISTEKLKLKEVKSEVTRTVRLPANKFLSYSHAGVRVTIPVEKFTEGRTEILVHPVNVQQGYSLKTFPDKITVRYQVALSRYNEVNASQFDAVVDAGTLVSGGSEKLQVQLMTSPVFIRSIFLEPDKVDYILRKQ